MTINGEVAAVKGYGLDLGFSSLASALVNGSKIFEFNFRDFRA